LITCAAKKKEVGKNLLPFNVTHFVSTKKGTKRI
jgi:hypothetical protein